MKLTGAAYAASSAWMEGVIAGSVLRLASVSCKAGPTRRGFQRMVFFAACAAAMLLDSKDRAVSW